MTQSKAQTKRQLVADARQASLDSRWDEAIELNQQIIARSPRDAEAHNRLGRALLALNRFGAAAEAYTTALRADPANMIARRNLQRLETLRPRHAAAGDGGDTGETAVSIVPRPNVFIEEVGKTWVDELVNPVAADELAEILHAEPLLVEIEGQRLVVKRRDGRRLGEIEARTAERVIELIRGGNRYEAYALGLSAQSLRIILRESFRAPAHATRVSFPRQITSRAYLRERDLLRQRDEAEFFFDDDDDDEDETVTPDADEEEGGEPEAEPFIEDTVTVVDEEEATL